MMVIFIIHTPYLQMRKSLLQTGMDHLSPAAMCRVCWTHPPPHPPPHGALYISIKGRWREKVSLFDKLGGMRRMTNVSMQTPSVV